ncbi:MAG: CcmD family protein [Acidobacteria bacterium]|nr:CcmD family protein [Acidobacteriota bacterium]
MPIGLKHFFFAYAFFWILLLGYLINLAFRQKRLADEIQELKETLARRGSP